MRNTVYLEKKLVPAFLRNNYSGNKFKAVIGTEMTIPADAGLWSGGTRSQYRVIRFADGAEVTMPGQDGSPWDSSRKARKIELTADFVVVEHTIFCGKDMGLTFYVHPDNATKLLPAPVELTGHEKIILTATRSFKSSYAGKDRYQMAREDFSYSRIHNGESFPSREQWEGAKLALINRGLLNKAGAITPAGRNAVGGR